MRKIYLDSIPRLEALKRLEKRVHFSDRWESLPVALALGRVTAEPVFARTSLPSYQASAMDGIAVRAAETFTANDQRPLVLKAPQQYVVVDTGDSIPEGFDAVIKIEEVQPVGEETLEIIAPAAPGQHTRAVGEDVVAGEIIVPAYHLLTPPDLGALLAGGQLTVKVLAKPRVAIIPTGDELVPAGSPPQKDTLIEFNGTVMSAYLQQWGAEAKVYPIIKDRLEDLRETTAKALEESDLVIINAGSSAGREDFTAQVVESLGEVLVHGVATRPAKPTILGIVGDKPLIGLPGYPVSAYLALDWFVKPLIHQALHQPVPQRAKIKATLGRRIVSDMGSEEFVRVTTGYINHGFVAIPLNRGAGVTMSLVKAHGLLTIPAQSLGYEQGQEVEIELLRPEHELRQTLVAVGSHDLALDLLGTAIRRIDAQLFLSSSHVGSMGGILAIKNGHAHLAGVHLFDSATGEYNIPYIQSLLPGEEVVLVNLVYRMQGFLVPKGNPMGIKTVRDIFEKKAVFINRQKGAGTRLLFDDLLAREHLEPQSIYGYEREEYTHLNVAAAVAAGTATTGLAILPAAQAYDLDFVPVAEERYDLLMRRAFYESSEGQVLVQVMTRPDFQAEIEALGGYSMREAGRVVYSV